MSTIKSSTTSTTAYSVVADTTGALVFQTGATPTTAMTLGADQSVTFAGTPTYTGGTANGVAYLNGSKVLTTGSALTYDGTNFGIGGAASTKLHVQGTGTQEVRVTSNTSGDIRFGMDVNGVAYNWIDSPRSSAAMVFGVANAEQMRLTSAGLGVGVSAVTNKLTIGTGTFATPATGTAGLYATTAAGLVVIADGFTVASRVGTDFIKVDSSGNLGLGVTPSAASGAYKSIEIGTVGNAVYGGTSSNSDCGVVSGAYFNAGWKYSVTGVNPCRFSMNDVVLGQMEWYTAASGTAGNAISFTQAMTLTAGGNLLVGTTSNANTARQYVRYDGMTTQMILNGATTTAASTSWVHYAGQSGNGSSITTNNIFIYGNGDIQNANNSYGALSDVKLKENIVDASPKLDNLMQVRIRNYNLKGDYENHKQLGVIAQELETVFPSMVEETQDRDMEGNDLGTTTKSVKYSVFVPMLIKAIQEQQALITQLQADVAALKGQA
jgi:hypothetical protein